MEKKRRARINNCLTQLKTLVLQAMRKDVSALFVISFVSKQPRPYDWKGTFGLLHKMSSRIRLRSARRLIRDGTLRYSDKVDLPVSRKIT